ncbi:MAG: BON domain-containing protein [Variovorax sp.]|nr:MAG: BON domain-containing protein [Variovorax sp.]
MTWLNPDTNATENPSDQALRQRILNALAHDRCTRAIGIDVQVGDGVATLTGRLASWAERLAVERAARSVHGVRALVFVLDVRSEPAHRRSDREIALAAVQGLRWNTFVPNEQVQLEVEQGWVTLHGEVEWDFQRSCAEDTVRAIEGVTDVRNRITLRPRRTATTVARLIQRALRRGAQQDADNIEVSSSGDRIVLNGKVSSWEQARLAACAARSTPEAGNIVNDLVVRSDGDAPAERDASTAPDVDLVAQIDPQRLQGHGCEQRAGKACAPLPV